MSSPYVEKSNTVSDFFVPQKITDRMRRCKKMAILREFKCMPRTLNIPLEATEHSTVRNVVIRYWFGEVLSDSLEKPQWYACGKLYQEANVKIQEC